MKKLILSVIFALMCLITQAQLSGKITAAEIGTRNSLKEPWNWYGPVAANIDITLIKEVIFIADKAGSHYITNEVIYDDGNTIQWTAIDEQDRRCEVMLTTFKDVEFIVIAYEKECYRYQVNYQRK